MFDRLGRAALLAASVVIFVAASAQAEVTLTVQPDGTNGILISGGGSINTTALTQVPYGSGVNGFLSAPDATAAVGPNVPADAYTGIAGPTSFNTSGNMLGGPGIGSSFGVSGAFNALFLPQGYTSGTVLSGITEITGENLAQAGLTAGTSFTYNWGSGSTADSFTVLVSGVNALQNYSLTEYYQVDPTDPTTRGQMMINFSIYPILPPLSTYNAPDGSYSFSSFDLESASVTYAGYAPFATSNHQLFSGLSQIAQTVTPGQPNMTGLYLYDTGGSEITVYFNGNFTDQNVLGMPDNIIDVGGSYAKVAANTYGNNYYSFPLSGTAFSATVPEPASMMLLGTCLLGLGAIRQRGRWRQCLSGLSMGQCRRVRSRYVRWVCCGNAACDRIELVRVSRW